MKYLYKAPSEFEVQSLAYNKLRGAFPRVRGEYKHPEAKGCRFDLAVFDIDDTLLCVVEIKRNVSKRQRTGVKQKSRYEEATGVPCVMIRGYQEASEVVERVKAILGGL